MNKKKTKPSVTLGPDEIVACPKCGQRFYSASALEDCKNHKCAQNLSDKELSQKVSKILATYKESVPRVIEPPPQAVSVEPQIEIPKVSLKSLPVGSKFEADETLYRKAFPIKDREIGQKLVRHQFSATLMLGAAKSFDPDTQVIKR